LRSSGAMPCGSQDQNNCGVTTAHRPFGSQGKQECLRHSRLRDADHGHSGIWDLQRGHAGEYGCRPVTD